MNCWINFGFLFLLLLLFVLFVACSGDDKTVRMWHIGAKECIAQTLPGALPDMARALCFYPDGDFIVAGLGGRLGLVSVCHFFFELVVLCLSFVLAPPFFPFSPLLRFPYSTAQSRHVWRACWQHRQYGRSYFGSIRYLKSSKRTNW